MGGAEAEHGAGPRLNMGRGRGEHGAAERGAGPRRSMGRGRARGGAGAKRGAGLREGRGLPSQALRSAASW